MNVFCSRKKKGGVGVFFFYFLLVYLSYFHDAVIFFFLALGPLVLIRRHFPFLPCSQSQPRG